MHKALWLWLWLWQKNKIQIRSLKLQIWQMDNNLRKFQHLALASAFSFVQMWKCSSGHSLLGLRNLFKTFIIWKKNLCILYIFSSLKFHSRYCHIRQSLISRDKNKMLWLETATNFYVLIVTFKKVVKCLHFQGCFYS